MKTPSQDIPVREIYKSYDYDKFKFLEYNRSVKDSRKLEKSIREIDITDCCPIVVTSDYHIIDGQHRFSICKQLNRPIYYVIFKGEAERAMVNLNVSATPWTQHEWLEYYCGKRNSVYLSLRDFMVQYPKLRLSNAILLFSAGKTNSETFKKGKLISANPRKDEMVSFLQECNHPCAFRRSFVNAVMTFMLAHEAKAIKKLQRKALCVPRFARTGDYVIAFENLVK